MESGYLRSLTNHQVADPVRHREPLHPRTLLPTVEGPVLRNVHEAPALVRQEIEVAVYRGDRIPAVPLDPFELKDLDRGDELDEPIKLRVILIPATGHVQRAMMDRHLGARSPISPKMIADAEGSDSSNTKAAMSASLPASPSSSCC